MNDLAHNQALRRFRIGGRKNFTLVEVALSVLLAALLMTGIVACFRSVFVLRDRNADRETLQRICRQCLSRIRRDLTALVPPDDYGLAGDLVGTNGEDSLGDLDTIEFSALVNRMHGSTFGTDIEQIQYEITADEDGNRILVRETWSNPLALYTEDAEETTLLTNVAGLNLEYYDGTDWLTSWDSSQQDGELPVAVRVTISLAGDDRPIQEIITTVAISVETAAELSQGGNNNAQ